MPTKNSVWIAGGAALLALGALAVMQQTRILSLAAAETGADSRAREAASQLARRRTADSAATMIRTDERRAVLAERLHFGVDRSAIRPTDAEILDEKIAILKANPRARIRIIGHCDERGGEIYNLALGRHRADAAREVLVQHGVDASRIETVSAGKGQPLDLQHNEEAWAKNRRDEFVIMGEQDSLGLRP